MKAYQITSKQGFFYGQTLNTDRISFENGRLIFGHLNTGETHFDRHVAEEELESIKDKLPDVQKNLVFGGSIFANEINYIGSEESSYENLPCTSYKMTLKGKSLEVCAVLHLSYAGDTDKWNTELIEKIEKVLDDGPESLKNETEIWWKETISSLDTCLHVMPMARILPSSTEAFSQ